mmetsp:Transcript_14180/g.39246  ORF Transcript_14180/g.39246 Transcript_14180/m.39246 type:complete len:394 (+) Transcript_14180:195-1376(+)
MPRNFRRQLSRQPSTVPKTARWLLNGGLVAISGVAVFISFSASSHITDLPAQSTKILDEFIGLSSTTSNDNRFLSGSTNRTQQKPQQTTEQQAPDVSQRRYTKNRLPNGEIKTELEWSFVSYSEEARRAKKDKKGKPIKRDETRQGARRLLIVQYTGWEDYYFGMTDISSRANKAYAKIHEFDYCRLNGVAYGSHKGPEATYNKIHILKQLRTTYKNMSYDAALLLDSDAVIVDFDFNVLDLLPKHILLTAHKVWPHDVTHTWNVNAGVTLWNLHHKLFDKFVKTWESKVLSKIRKGGGVSDQGKLQQTLREYGAKDRLKLGVINALNTTQFQPRNGTFVRHFIRQMHGVDRNWSYANGKYFEPSEDRVRLVEGAVEEACRIWPRACKEEELG